MIGFGTRGEQEDDAEIWDAVYSHRDGQGPQRDYYGPSPYYGPRP